MSFFSQKIIKNPVVVSVLTLFLGLGISAQLSAHSGATGVVKERMDRMQTMKQSMKAMGDMVKGKSPLLAEEMEKQSRLILTASEGIPHTFPQGSTESPSEALPTIWQNWDRFVSLSSSLDDQTTKLLSVAAGTDQRAIKVQYVKVAKACRACHADYRKKKEQAQ